MLKHDLLRTWDSFASHLKKIHCRFFCSNSCNMLLRWIFTTIFYGFYLVVRFILTFRRPTLWIFSKWTFQKLCFCQNSMEHKREKKNHQSDWLTLRLVDILYFPFVSLSTHFFNSSILDLFETDLLSSTKISFFRTHWSLQTNFATFFRRVCVNCLLLL